MTSQTSTENIALAARKAYQASQLIPSSERINALHAIKTALEASKEQILAANKLDVDVRITCHM
jgi:glutamate-5-semialdehyde dehydrogenase